MTRRRAGDGPPPPPPPWHRPAPSDVKSLAPSLPPASSVTPEPTDAVKHASGSIPRTTKTADTPRSADTWLRTRRAPAVDLAKSSEPATDPVLLQKYLRSVLDIAFYHDAKRKVAFDNVPIFVRRTPEFVRAMLAGEAHYLAWAATQGDLAYAETVAQDLETLLLEPSTIVRSLPILSSAARSNPRVVEVVCRHIHGYAHSFSELPADLRSEPNCVRAAVSSNFNLIKDVPEPYSEEVASVIVAEARKCLGRDERVIGSVPAQLRRRPDFLQAVAQLAPAGWRYLDDDERRIAARYYEDAKVIQNAVAVAAKNLLAGGYREKTSADVLNVPPALLASDEYRRMALRLVPRSVGWMGITSEQVARMFDVPNAFADWHYWQIGALVAALPEDTVLAPVLLTAISGAIEKDARTLDHLPRATLLNSQIAAHAVQHAPITSQKHLDIATLDDTTLDSWAISLAHALVDGHRVPDDLSTLPPRLCTEAAARIMLQASPCSSVPALLVGVQNEVLAQPEFRLRATTVFGQRLSGIWNMEERRQAWNKVPEVIRSDADCMAIFMRHRSIDDLVETPPERAAVAAVLRDPVKLIAPEFPLLRKLKDVPEPIAKDPRVLGALAELVAQRTQEFEEVPAALRAEPTLYAPLLRKHPELVKSIPWPDTAAAQAPLRQHWLAVVSASTWSKFPAALREDSTFIDAAVRKTPAIITEFSLSELESAQPALNDPDTHAEVQGISRWVHLLSPAQRTLRTLVKAVAQDVRSDSRRYTQLPRDLRENHVIFDSVSLEYATLASVPFDAETPPRFRARVIERTLEQLAKGRLDWANLPEVMRNDPEVVKPAFCLRPELISSFGEEARTLASQLIDPAFLTKAGKGLLMLLEHTPATTLADEGVRQRVLAAFETEPSSYHRLPPSYRREPRALLAAVRHSQRFERIHLEALTEAGLLALIEDSPSHVWHVVPDDRWTPAVHQRLRERIFEVYRSGTKVNVPSFLWSDLEFKRSLAHQFGVRPLQGCHAPADRWSATIWNDAPREKVLELINEEPEHWTAVQNVVSRDPELALVLLRNTKDANRRSQILDSLSVELYDEPAFAIDLMAVAALAFRHFPERLRGTFEVARAAILSHPGNVEHAKVSADELRSIVSEVRVGDPWTTPASPWNEEPRLDEKITAATDFGHRDLFLRRLTRDVAAAQHMPLAYASDPEVVALAASKKPAALSQWPYAKLSLDEQARVKATMFELARARPSLFAHLPAELRADVPLLQELLPRAPQLIRSASGEASKSSELWQLAMRHDARLSSDCPFDTLKSFGVECVVEQLRDRRLKPTQTPEGLHRKHPRVISAAIDGWGGAGVTWWVNHLTSEPGASSLRNALEKEPERLAHGLTDVPLPLRKLLTSPDFRDSDVAIRFATALMQHAPQLLTQLPPHLSEHPKVARLARQGAPHLRSIVEIGDEEQRRRFIMRYPESLLQLPPEQRTRELVLTAVHYNGELLKSASVELRDDREVVLAAVSAHGGALQFASVRLRADFEVVNAAVLSHPQAADFAEFQGPDNETKLRVLSARCRGLTDAQKGWLEDKDVVLAFARHLSDRTYKGTVRLHEELFRFERHLSDADFVDALIDARPELLEHLPSPQQTPTRVLRAARAGKLYTESDGALDPLRLPAALWPELAALQPHSMTRQLTANKNIPADSPARVTSWLAAIRQNHDAIDNVAPAAWTSSDFMGAAVTANSLVFRKLAPARQLWLRVLQPEAVAHAEDFLRRLGACNIASSRFKHSFPALEEIVRCRTRKTRDSRPVAVVVYPKHDHNGAFGKARVAELQKRYRVMYYEAADVSDIIRALKEATEHAPASVLVLSGHGTPTSQCFGEMTDASGAMPELTMDTLRVLRKAVPRSRLADGARIILDACSTGGGGSSGHNLVTGLGAIWPHCWVQGAWHESSGGNRLVFFDDGLLNRMDFRKNDTLHPIPYAIATPSEPIRGSRPLR